MRVPAVGVADRLGHAKPHERQRGGGAAGVAAAAAPAGATAAVDAHDDVNRGQSSNDVFPTAMHLAVALRTKFSLLPALAQLRGELAAKAEAFATWSRSVAPTCRMPRPDPGPGVRRL
jgi:hypothetical protein